MTKEEIINQLAHNPKIKKIAQNIAGAKGLGDDLYQYLFLTLCEMPEEKIQSAHEKKFIDFLAIKIMQNSYHSFTSPFAIQYRQHIIDAEIEINTFHVCPDKEAETIEALNLHEVKVKPVEDYLNQEINQDNFYKLTLLREWAGGSSYRKIAARTKIPMRSIAHAIQTAIKEIKEKC